MAGNSNLNNSARNKQDEFYTQLSLVESELKHYRHHFKGKTVLCNCDDPYESNFFKYFAMNFNALGLKKLITTCYATSPVTGKEFQYFVDKGGQLSFIPSESNTPYRKKMCESLTRWKSPTLQTKTGMGALILQTLNILCEIRKTQ